MVGPGVQAGGMAGGGADGGGDPACITPCHPAAKYVLCKGQAELPSFYLL